MSVFKVDTIGYRIAMIRRMANISQADIASSTGLTVNIINNIEHGRHRVNTEQIEAIANFFSIPAAVLVPNNFVDKAGISDDLDKAFIKSLLYVFNNEREMLQWKQDNETQETTDTEPATSEDVLQLSDEYSKSERLEQASHCYLQEK